MKIVLICFSLLFSSSVYGQKFSSVAPNRFGYFGIGKGPYYWSVKSGIEIQPFVYVDVQAFSDGGYAWKRENKHNDWRTLSIQRGYRIDKANTEIRGGMGVLQTAEFVRELRDNSWGSAAQLGVLWVAQPHLSFSVNYTLPMSPAYGLKSALNFSFEYRWGYYKKENGLYPQAASIKF